MKKSILSNPAFRYIFEVFIIVFSVTISFYIQDVLNEKDRIEIKNKALSGVLKDITGDSSLDTRTAWIEKIMAVDPYELHQKIMDEIGGK